MRCGSEPMNHSLSAPGPCTVNNLLTSKQQGSHEHPGVSRGSGSSWLSGEMDGRGMGTL